MHKLILFYFTEEVILAEERTTDEEKMHIIEGNEQPCFIVHEPKKICVCVNENT